ncbi:MAG: DNA-processing protein DprA [Alphaproteobacteria bacterium]|nr:DNA-processing protein DprA [Alphaproteobacteria bacterium]
MIKSMSDIFKKLLILRTPGIGPAKYNTLLEKFGNLDDIVATINPSQELRDTISDEMARAQSLHIYYVSDQDDSYPHVLRATKNHPPVITVRGNLDVLGRDMVSIVGTRHATAAGMQLVADIAQRFAENNTVVVSGMAIGTDTAAHRGALRAVSGAGTVAVLAGGVDYIWPLENESLYWDIVKHGAIISDMPIGYKPVANNFVMRNRIVAGLSSRLILGEADMKSGSMTTVRFASELNRQVWAIPSHPLDLRSFGPNSLIRSGVAKLCMGPSDFFQDEKKDTHLKKNSKKINDKNNLIDALGTIPVSESVLAEIVKKSISEIKSELVVLELGGIVRKVDGGYVLV